MGSILQSPTKDKPYIMFYFFNKLKLLPICLMLAFAAQAQGDNSDKARLEAAWALKSQSHTDSAMHMAIMLLPRFKQQRDLRSESECHVLLGLLWRDHKEYAKSYAAFKEALDIRQKTNDERGQASVFNNVASVLRMENRYVEAGDTINRAIKIYQRLGDSLNLGKAYVTLSNIYQDNKNYRSAEKYLQEAISIYKIKRDTEALVRAEYNLGNLFYSTNDLEAAKKYYKHSLQYFIGMGDWHWEAQTYNMLGRIWMVTDSTDKAQEAISKATSIFQQHQYAPGLYETLVNQGSLYRQLDKRKDALAAFTKAKSIYQGDAGASVFLYEQLADLYQDLQKKDSSFFYGQLALDSMQVLLNSNQNGHLDKYMSHKRDQEKIENALAITQKEKQRNFWASVALLGALLFMAFVMWNQRRINRAEREREALVYAQKVEDLNNKLEVGYMNARLEGQLMEKKSLGRDLHDRIGALMATLKWRYEAIGEKIEGQPEMQRLLKEANQSFADIYQELRTISHRLESEGEPNKVELMDALRQLCAALNQTGKINAQAFFHGLEGRLDYKIEINLLQIIREIVANTLKHAEAKNLTIQISKIDQGLTLMTEDDGKGFALSSENKGVGLRNLEARVAALGGSLQIDSVKGSGTTLIVEIPLTSSYDNITLPFGYDKTDTGLFGG